MEAQLPAIARAQLLAWLGTPPQLGWSLGLLHLGCTQSPGGSVRCGPPLDEWRVSLKSG